MELKKRLRLHGLITMMQWCLVLDFILFCEIISRKIVTVTKIDGLYVIIINRESNQHHISRAMRKPVFEVLRPGPTQTGLYSWRLEMSDL